MPKKKKRPLSLQDICLPGSLRRGVPYSFQEDGVSQTLISTFMCRQKWMLTLNRLTKEYTTTVFGSLFHDMLECTYTFCRLKRRVPPPVLYKKWMRTIFAKLSAKGVGAKYMQELEDSYNLVTIMFPIYLDHYKKDFTNKKWIEVEGEFKIEYMNTVLRGKRDGLFLAGKSKKLYLAEHKTKSRMNEDTLILRLGLDFQNLFYILATELEQKCTVSGVLYNIIRNPNSRPGKKETIKQFYERMRLTIDKNRNYYFVRHELSYTQQDKDDFKKELDYILEEMQEVFNEGLPIYKNRFACEKPYQCRYLELCATGSLSGYHQKENLFEELTLNK